MLEDVKHEDKCLKCGRCCAIKLIVNGEIYYTADYCPYLDENTRRCTIYEKRYELCSDCLSIKEAIKLHALPADCPYVRDIPNYHPPYLGLSLEEINRIIEGKKRGKEQEPAKKR